MWMSSYGLGALALVALACGLVPRIPAFVAAASIVVGGCAALTWPSDPARVPDWLVMTAGLAAWVCGLAIVRLMLDRSVSLRLLEQLEAGGTRSFDDDIGRRLMDLRRLRLVRTTPRGQSLSTFGQAVAVVVAMFQRAARVDNR